MYCLFDGLISVCVENNTLCGTVWYAAHDLPCSSCQTSQIADTLHFSSSEETGTAPPLPPVPPLPPPPLSLFFMHTHLLLPSSSPIIPLLPPQKKDKTTPHTPFRRVKEDIQVDPKVANNSFEAKVPTLLVFVLLGNQLLTTPPLSLGWFQGLLGREGKQGLQVH